MAQTTTATTTSAAVVQVKIASGSYTSISGSTNSVDTVTIEVATGSKGTLEGGEQIIQSGRQVETTVTVNCLYTETTDEALKLTLASIKAGNVCQVKWFPVASGGKSFNTAENGRILKVKLPAPDAEKGEPLMFSFDVFCGGIETSFT
jgi:hypothetical protein